ncbi:unnamed protein product [Miscanthus lutarioriparius]|uniref:Disease resistance R13L4/SHOC-2-like LRR domain-containing protein n=1 Tax=Miscanthus lutarioriparius TaxID=422564 RepID=A0A811QAG6_9POAL|nr:unnamed protein product [Miscanthus lutarioriparius]
MPTGPIEIGSNDGVGLDFGLGLLPSLQEIHVWLDDEGASIEEAKEWKAMLWHASNIHPNHPSLEIKNEDKRMMPRENR